MRDERAVSTMERARHSRRWCGAVRRGRCDALELLDRLLLSGGALTTQYTDEMSGTDLSDTASIDADNERMGREG